MKENEEIFFITNTLEYNTKQMQSTSPTSSTSPGVSASYIRDWQTEGACAQLYLTRLQLNEFKEYGNNKTTRKLSPPKLRYKYLKEEIIIYLLNNGQISIPLRALSCIEKGTNKEIKLILKEDKKRLIDFKWNEYYTHGKKVVIKENIRSSRFLLLRFHKDVLSKEIDIVCLHIDYLINKNNSKIIPQSSWSSNWGRTSETTKNQDSIIYNNKELAIKFHFNDEIRIFLFDSSLQFQEIKEHIEEACNLPAFRKLKYKDEDDEFITISSQEELKTAFTLYSKNNKLEMWHF